MKPPGPLAQDPSQPQPAKGEVGEEGTTPLAAPREGDRPKRPPSARMTRRAVLGGTALLAGATPPGATPQGTVPANGGGLVALCGQAMALDQEGDRLTRGVESLPDTDPACAAAWDEADALAEKWERLVVRICALPAVAPDELRAKALLLRTLLPCGPAGNLHAAADPAEALAWSLAGDLLRIAGMAEISPEGGLTGGPA